MPSTTSPANAAATGAPAATAPGVAGVVACVEVVGAGGTGAGVAGAASTSGPAGTTEGTDGCACRAAPCPTLGDAVAGRATSRAAAAVETARRGARIPIPLPDAQFTTARTTGCSVTISTIAAQRHLHVKRSCRHDP